MSRSLISSIAAGLLLLSGCASTANRTVQPLPAEPAGPVARATPADGNPGAAEPQPHDSDTASPFEGEPEGVTPTPAVESASMEGAELGDDPHDVVVIVEGEPVRASELIGAWMMSDAREVQAFIEKLVLNRLVLLEAARIGLTLSDEDVELARNELYAMVAEGVRRSGTGMTTEEFIQTELGLDPDFYFDKLDRESVIELLGNRVIRAWLLASDRAEIRVIRVDTRSSREEVEARLAKGLAFADIARELSIDESGKSGGASPPVVRGDTPISHLAFSTRKGQVGGPIFVNGSWLFVFVEARHEAMEGSWQDVGSAVEASLRDRPVEDPEFWQWKSAMLEVYEVDMTPFLELMGGLTSQD